MTKNDYYELVVRSFRPAETLIGMVPSDNLAWRPGPTFMSLGQVICHLSEGIGGEFGTLLTGKWPSMAEMEEGMKLENMASCGVQEALEKLAKDRTTLRSVLDGISGADFANRMVSTPWGWKGKLEIMAVNFLGHFTNHKMQLFTYLKLLGLPVNTETLYGT